MSTILYRCTECEQLYVTPDRAVKCCQGVGEVQPVDTDTLTTTDDIPPETWTQLTRERI